MSKMSLDNGSVENICSSLIREYLSRKGLVQTLQCMDDEMPRTDASVNKRATLAKEAHLEKLMKKNKEQDVPLRAMLEVLLKYHIEKAAKRESVSASISDITSSPATIQTSDDHGSPKRSDHRKKQSQLRKTETASTTDFGGLPQEDTGKTYKKENPLYVTIKTETETKRVSTPLLHHTDIPSRDDEFKPVQNVGTRKTTRPTTGMRSRGIGGPVTSSIETNRSTSKRSSKTSSIGTNERTSPFSSSLSKTDSSTKDRLKDFGFNFEEKTSETTKKDDPELNVREEPDLLNGPHPAKSKQKPTEQKCEDASDLIVDRSLSRRSHSSSGKQKNTLNAPRSVPPKKEFGDMTMDDVDDLEEDLGNIQLGPSFRKSFKYVDARPLTLKKASELKSLIFGSPSGCFNDEWMKQGFPFNVRPQLEFGIIQHKGGSCGVLASVQACFLRHLLFSDDRMISPDDLRPGKKEQTKCLAKALSGILWQAGTEKRVILSMPSGKVQFTAGGRYKGDGLTETLILYHFASLPDLEEYLIENIGFFINPTGNGVVVFLYSLIFTKSLEGVISEMDEPTNHLMGHHNYCTQETVNLILTGRAVSNVFNDVMELDSGTGPKCILNGLKKRSDVGMLSLFEHYGSCKVGSYYKTPRFPVWVICSESHFSVIFSLKKNLLSDWKAERNFDLYYYDGLANQEELIKLSVNTIASCSPSDEGDLVPPLEHCIRTKWRDALIDWNGSEPIL